LEHSVYIYIADKTYYKSAVFRDTKCGFITLN